MTFGPGNHSRTNAPDGKHYIDNIRSGGTIKIEVRDDKHQTIQVLYDGPWRSLENSKDLSIKTPDGFNLPAKIYYPKNFDPSKKYPVIFDVYGGPDSRGGGGADIKSYSNIEDQVIFFEMEHRGSGSNGKKGLDYLWRNLGHWEITDYIEGVKWLRQQPYVDSTKIGITGHSYGGYVTMMALTKGCDYFTHGIALSGVTDWHLYDNIYTERYMDKPEQNPKGYEESSVLYHAHKLKGKLLIIHGEADTNVHVQHAYQLAGKLQDLGKDFDLMIYPGAGHSYDDVFYNYGIKLQKDWWRKHGFWIPDE